MAVVNTNISASVAQSALIRNERAMSTAMERLSTGQRINSAGDDAAGLAVATRMTSQVIGLGTAIRNANDGISMLNTAEGAMIEMTTMLQRMRELALQASSGTTDVKDRTNLNKEYQALYQEIDRIADNTEWNGRKILNNTADGSSSGFVEFQVGMNMGGTEAISVDFGNLTNIAGSGTFLHFSSTGAAGTISATTTGSAQTTASGAIGKIDTALDDISSKRAVLGATVNRLTHTVDNLTNIRINAESTRSAILDTDYASETSALAKSQIIAQAGTAMLAQANQLPQTVLALLR
jgi:flagellin